MAGLSDEEMQLIERKLQMVNKLYPSVSLLHLVGLYVDRSTHLVIYADREQPGLFSTDSPVLSCKNFKEALSLCADRWGNEVLILSREVVFSSSGLFSVPDTPASVNKAATPSEEEMSLIRRKLCVVNESYPSVSLLDLVGLYANRSTYLVVHVDHKQPGGLFSPGAPVSSCKSIQEVNSFCVGRSRKDTKVLSWQEVFGSSDLLSLSETPASVKKADGDSAGHGMPVLWQREPTRTTNAQKARVPLCLLAAVGAVSLAVLHMLAAIVPAATCSDEQAMDATYGGLIVVLAGCTMFYLTVSYFSFVDVPVPNDEVGAEPETPDHSHAEPTRKRGITLRPVYNIRDGLGVCTFGGRKYLGMDTIARRYFKDGKGHYIALLFEGGDEGEGILNVVACAQCDNLTSLHQQLHAGEYEKYMVFDELSLKGEELTQY